MFFLLVGCIIFLSTLSLRRATDVVIRFFQPLQISIHALLAESDRFIQRTCLMLVQISIHALLAESDSFETPENMEISISIHALLAESDFDIFACFGLAGLFLSTLSLRRATLHFSDEC